MNERIKMVRRQSGLSLERFGSQIGISAAACSMIESGKSNPAPRTIKAICREFCVSEDWIRTGEGEMKINRTEEEELDEFVKDILCDDDDTRKRFVLALSKIPPEAWSEIAEFWKRFGG